MNNKIKVIKRIAFGYRDLEYFFLEIKGLSMSYPLSNAYNCCGGPNRTGTLPKK